MNQQSNSTATKKRWLVLLFISPIILFAVLLFFRFFSSNIPLFAKLSTSFTPEELAKMAQNFSVDYVAGECTNKGFFEVKGDDNLFNSKYKVLSYYNFGKKLDKASIAYNDYISDRADKMKERITPVKDFNCINYTIKNKQNYEGFIRYLKKTTQDSVISGKEIYNDSIHYILRNSVFVDSGYKTRFQGYVVCIYPVLFGNAANELVSGKSSFGELTPYIKVLNNNNAFERELIRKYIADSIDLERQNLFYYYQHEGFDTLKNLIGKMFRINGVYVKIGENPFELHLIDGDSLSYHGNEFDDLSLYERNNAVLEIRTHGYINATGRGYRPIEMVINGKTLFVDFYALQKYQADNIPK